MRRVNINQFEKAGYQDQNNNDLALFRSLYDDTLYPLFQGNSGVLATSFVASYTGALTLSLAAGTGFFYDSSQTGYSPRYRMLLAASAIPVTLAAANGSNPRIDLICLTPNQTITQQTRFVKTGGTGPIVSQLVDKDVVDSYTLTVVTGTPGVSPAVPATPAGAIVIAKALVHTSTGMASQADVTDLRTVLYPAIPLSAVAGENLTAGQLAYLSPATGVDGARTLGSAYKVDPGVTNGAVRYANVGVVLATVLSGAAVTLLATGPAGGFTGLTVGGVYYADPSTPGGVTLTKPITSGQFIVPVGIAISTTVMLVNATMSALAQIVTTPNAYPNYFCTSEADLATAISSATSNGGGVICLLNSFTVSSARVIPAGTRLIGRDGGSVITIASSGSITLSDGGTMENVYFTTALTSGSMVLLTNNYSKVRDCQFTIPIASTGQCINVTGNANRMYNNRFIGVAGEVATGINYAAGVDNTDSESVFLA